MRIRLLGKPAVEGDGGAVRPPRGRKAWALLCYLVLAERPPGRQHLAELLFGDADDPLGALRWTLAELRRSLGLSDAFGGDPVATALPDGVVVDVRSLEHDEPAALLELGGELLEGLTVASSPQFESWLLVARHRTSALVEARLRQAAVGLLAAGDGAAAVAYAERAVARNPLEEGNHELLVRGLAAAGDRAAALRQVEACAVLLRRELGIDVSPALREAAYGRTGSSVALPVSGRAAATSQLDAGRAAIAAGAVEAGIQCLRRAVDEAARCHDPVLQGKALVALGGALVHALRGRDQEGALVLHEAIRLAQGTGDRAVAVTAHRELGFVEVQAGRASTADSWLGRAQAMAETDDELAAIQGVRGMHASDSGDYPAALRHLRESVERAARCGDGRQQAWSASILARAHLLRGEHGEAADCLAESLRLVHEHRWLAFLPWPQSLRAELDLSVGDLDGAADTLEHAWALACQLGDPCWEGMAARGLGLLHAGRGDRDGSRAWFGEAHTRSIRVTDRYLWVHAHVLDGMAGAALDRHDHAEAAVHADALATLAARCGMRELVVRAQLHRHRLGDDSALATARIVGAGVDNPALHRLIELARFRVEAS